jgi:Fe-S oxidoreductase
MTLKSILVLLAFFAAVSVFGYRCYVRFQHMRLGRRGVVFGRWGERLKGLTVFVAAQARIFRFPDTGIAHFFIFWGFLLLFPTILQAVLEGLVPGLALPVLSTFGPALLAQDLIAVAVAVAVLYGLYVRLIRKPERYEGSHHGEAVLVLGFILTIMVTLLGFTGISLNLGETHGGPGWQPVSATVGALFAGLSPDIQRVIREAFWWTHLGVILVFLTLLPGGKHFHVFTSIPNVLLRGLEPPGRLEPLGRDSDAQGVEKIEEFTWRQMLDWYSCSECGRCQDVCPAHLSGAALSPKKLIMGLREHLFERGQALRAHPKNGQTEAVQTVLARRLTGDVIPDDWLWACTTCQACDRECPLFVEHVWPVVELRRSLLAQGRGDKMLTTALQSLRRYGNSFGKSDKQRAKWTTGLDFKIKDIRRQTAHTLWYVGDYASYNPTAVPATQAAARALRKAGVDFGLLYDAELNVGNDVRRAGEEGLFRLLTQKNATALGRCTFQQVVTTDPHTYNTLKNEPWIFGPERPAEAVAPVAVLHMAEVFDQALREGRLKVARPLGATVTYHDPCYLGRYNGVYDAPRRVIEALGCRLVEMPRSRDRALCCGAGGGRIWMEEAKVKERPSESRVREAAALSGVTLLVVACPKDLTMYRDAVKTAGLEGRLEVKDLAELVDETCDGAAAPPEAGADARASVQEAV